MLITGNRGCGKTVLLRELQRLASERGWAVVSDSASLGLCDRLADALRSNKPVVTSMEFGPSFGRMSVEAARAKGETLRGLVNERLKKLGPARAYCLRLTRRNLRLSKSWRLLPLSISKCSEIRMLRDCPIATSAVLRWCSPAYPEWLTICSKSRALRFCGVPSSVRWGRYLCPRCAIHISRRSKTLVFTLTRRRRPCGAQEHGASLYGSAGGLLHVAVCCPAWLAGHRKARCREWPCGCRLRVLRSG